MNDITGQQSPFCLKIVKCGLHELLFWRTSLSEGVEINFSIHETEKSFTLMH